MNPTKEELKKLAYGDYRQEFLKIQLPTSGFDDEKYEALNVNIPYISN
jgi:hypothetical protein